MTDLELFDHLAKEAFGSLYDDLEFHEQHKVDRLFDDHIAKTRGGKIIHDGYVAEFHWDKDSQRFVARMIDVDAIIHFEAQDEQELREEMANSIESYLEFVEEMNEFYE